MSLFSNGAVSTNSAAAVTLIANATGVPCKKQVNVVNSGSGSGDGLVSIDGGTTYPYYLPAAPSSRTIPLPAAMAVVVKVKRAGATDLSGVYGDAD